MKPLLPILILVLILTVAPALGAGAEPPPETAIDEERWHLAPHVRVTFAVAGVTLRNLGDGPLMHHPERAQLWLNERYRAAPRWEGTVLAQGDALFAPWGAFVTPAGRVYDPTAQAVWSVRYWDGFRNEPVVWIGFLERDADGRLSWEHLPAPRPPRR